MRAFLILVLLMAFCFVAGALLAYPAYLLVHPLNEGWPFHRVAARLAMLLLVVGLIFVLRHLQVRTRSDWGYAVPRPRFIRTLLGALVLGVVSMLPVAAILFGLDVRELKPQVSPDLANVLVTTLGALLAGLVVATVEESALRGAMFTAIERESGARVAIGLTAVLYSALHFLSRVRIAHEDVSWGSGLDLLAATFATFSRPQAIIDSFLALAAVGVLLGMIRARTGHIAACIGLHAGWVCVIGVLRELSVRNRASPWSFLAGDYDGVVGWLVLLWAAIIIGIYSVFGRRMPGTVTAAPHSQAPR
jgi:membrane protease YdiL (CAAX protease family)